MSFLCPKCEHARLKSGVCEECGYVLKLRCYKCGHINIPSARFCGVCGRGMTFGIRAKSFVNRRISFIQKMRVRRFALGLVFGALLILFAFGSMGMKGSENDFSCTATADSLKLSTSDFISAPPLPTEAKPLPELFENSISDYFSTQDCHRPVGLEDLKYCVNAVRESLSASQNEHNTACEYMINLGNFADRNAITRANAAMAIFYLLSDALNLRYRDFPQECGYNDIPRFHFLTVPANALAKYKIALARDERRFGINDVLTLSELKAAATDVMRALVGHSPAS